jgi:hypothetical protein
MNINNFGSTIASGLGELVGMIEREGDFLGVGVGVGVD